MLGLPKSTEFNKTIPKGKLFSNALSSDPLRQLYDEQVAKVVWRNKLSNATYPPYASYPSGMELEVMEVKTLTSRLDKRLMRTIDRHIPYYSLYLVSHESQYQAWIAKKRFTTRTVYVDNYYRTGWLSKSDITFDFSGHTPLETLNTLVEQVQAKVAPIQMAQIEQCNAFLEYFRTMKMTRSYKPVLVLATIQSGGAITLEKAAMQFIRYYQGRAKRGQIVENGYCIYGDAEAPLNKIYNNLITMPIAALCGSGYFTYDNLTRTFSFADDIYDGLSMDEIDEIVASCKMRLQKYFERLG